MKTIYGAWLIVMLFFSATLPAQRQDSGPVLNQGNKPYCTSYATVAWAQAMFKGLRLDPVKMHDRATQIDGVLHTDRMNEGTNHWATQRVLKEWGYADGYRTTASIDEAINWLNYAPILVALMWHDGSFVAVKGTPNIRYVPDGPTYSAHEIVCYAYQKPDVLCQNSWGTSFADNGRFRINKADIQRIMNEYGNQGTVMQPLLIFLTPIRGAF